MAPKQRRYSQNTQYMRQILTRLREYDVEEVRLLCERFLARNDASSSRTTRIVRYPRGS